MSKPVNFMVGIKGKLFSVAELQAAGVKRIGLATSLHGAAMTALIDAAREIREHGTFDYLNRKASAKALSGLMRDWNLGSNGGLRGRRTVNVGATRMAGVAARLF